MRKRINYYEREQEGIYGRIWREPRERGNDILQSQKQKKLKN